MGEVHELIWLEPEDEADEDTGRLWCEDNQWGDDSDAYILKARYDALVAALTSIANNTCCEGCGEAAKVARAALAAPSSHNEGEGV